MIETFFSDKIFSWIFSKSDLLCLKRPNLAFVMGFLPSARWGIVQKSDTVKSKILEKNSKKHIFRKKYMIETFFSDKIFSWDFSKSDLLCLKRTNLAFIMWFSHLTSPNLNLRVCVGGHMKLPFWTASDVISESLQAFCQFFFCMRPYFYYILSFLECLLLCVVSVSSVCATKDACVDTVEITALLTIISFNVIPHQRNTIKLSHRLKLAPYSSVHYWFQAPPNFWRDVRGAWPKQSLERKAYNELSHEVNSLK